MDETYRDEGGQTELLALLAALQELADSIKDNAPDQENDAEIAAEYELLVAVYVTMQAAIDYIGIGQDPRYTVGG